MGITKSIVPRDVQASNGISKLRDPVSCVVFALAVDVWSAGIRVWNTVWRIACILGGSLWLKGGFIRHVVK